MTVEHQRAWNGSIYRAEMAACPTGPTARRRAPATRSGPHRYGRHYQLRQRLDTLAHRLSAEIDTVEHAADPVGKTDAELDRVSCGRRRSVSGRQLDVRGTQSAGHRPLPAGGFDGAATPRHRGRGKPLLVGHGEAEFRPDRRAEHPVGVGRDPEDQRVDAAPSASGPSSRSSGARPARSG